MPCKEQKAAKKRARSRTAVVQAMHSDTFKFTPERQLRFLTEVARTGLLNKSCEKVGMSPKTIREFRGRHEEFEDLVQDALRQFEDSIRKEIVRRGREGFVEDIFYRGKKVGERRVFSDTCLLALAKAKLPEFRNSSGEGPGVGGGALVVPSAPQTADDWEAIFQGATAPKLDGEEEDMEGEPEREAKPRKREAVR